MGQNTNCDGNIQVQYPGLSPNPAEVKTICDGFSRYHRSLNGLIEQIYTVYNGAGVSAEQFEALANSLSLYSQYSILLLTCLGHRSHAACGTQKTMQFLEFIKAAGRRLLSAQERIVSISDEIAEHEGHAAIKVRSGILRQPNGC